MNTYGLDGQLRDWLIEGPTGAPAEVVERALAQAALLPQPRPVLRWPLLPRLALPPVRGALRLALTLLLLALTFGVGAWLVAQQLRLPPPTPTPLPSAALEWQRVGQVDGTVRGLVQFNDGYLVFGEVFRGEELVDPGWTWFGTNGSEWELAKLPAADICPSGETIREPSVGATDGDSIVLAGRAADCAATWVSADGVNWQKSASFATQNSGEWVRLWPTVDGWELIADSPAGGLTTVWQSSDGLDWERVGSVGDDPGEVLAGAIGPDGTRVVTLNGRVLVSPDGLDWRPLDALTAAAGERTAMSVVPPTTEDPKWLIPMTASGDVRVRSIWMSSDLVTWRSASLAVEQLSPPERTRFGYVVLARGYPAAGQDLYPRLQLVSEDGLAWQQVPASAALVDQLIDGPAGVLGLASTADGNTTEVWRLQPSPTTSPSPPATVPPAPGPLQWSDPAVLPTQQFLEYSMAVDSAGVVHIAGAVFQDGIYHVSNEGGTWTSQRVTTAPTAPQPGQDAMPIIRLDGDVPTIAFVRYGNWEGEGVAFYPVDPQGVFLTAFDGGGWSAPVRVAIDWNGPEQAFQGLQRAYAYDMDVRERVVHLAWADDTGVWHATNASRQWVEAQVDTRAGEEPRLRLAGDGTPRLVFAMDDGVYFAFSSGPGGSFPTDTARLVALGAHSPLLALDSGGGPHVVYDDGQPPSGDNPGGATYAAHPFASSGHVFGTYGVARSLAVDGANGVHVLGVANDSYVYAGSVGGPFAQADLIGYSEPVDGPPPQGQIVVDGSGRAHVVLETIADGWQLVYLTASGAAASGPSPSAQPTPLITNVVRSDVKEGAFSLRIEAAKDKYLSSERVFVSTAVAYAGPPATQLVSGSAVAIVGIEQLDGDIAMLPADDSICMTFALEDSVLVTSLAGKPAGVTWLPSDPNAAFYEAFYADADNGFALPPGRWRITAATDFALGIGCSGEVIDLQAAIIIEVLPG